MVNSIRENENKGFSLVELIVVIAIMAVMAAVLAPSLLGYVERSRAQKDDSAMGELTNSIKLALADQDVFDECLAYTAKDNYSCYVDGALATLPTTAADGYIETKGEVTSGSTSNVQFRYSDELRKLDETEYKLAGKMRGFTVTFSSIPESGTAAENTNKAVFDLAEGVVNAGGTGTAGRFGGMSSAGATGAGTTGKLYNRVRATVGDKIELSSQTYRNSNYTVFVKMGTTGGNQAVAQDAVEVYGQWNGTNLASAKKSSTILKFTAAPSA